MKVLIVDNYDSFTYNLVDILRRFHGTEIGIVYNDHLKWKQVEGFDKILISPGPGIPSEAGQLTELIQKYHALKPILGICLGHQAIAEVFNAKLINLSFPRHGQTEYIWLSAEEPLFSGLSGTIKCGLYHSWTVDPESLPPELKVIASIHDGIMGIRHRDYDVVGLQFHPESYATSCGLAILQNWLGIGG